MMEPTFQNEYESIKELRSLFSQNDSPRKGVQKKNSFNASINYNEELFNILKYKGFEFDTVKKQLKRLSKKGNFSSLKQLNFEAIVIASNRTDDDYNQSIRTRRNEKTVVFTAKRHSTPDSQSNEKQEEAYNLKKTNRTGYTVNTLLTKSFSFQTNSVNSGTFTDNNTNQDIIKNNGNYLNKSTIQLDDSDY